MAFEYLEIEEVISLHADQIDLWGGRHGIADIGLVTSALMRPRHKANYGLADLEQQAASLLFGLAKNHGFIDGNKWIALVATDVFLQLNGHELACSNDEAAELLERCSVPDWTEETVEASIRMHITQLRAP